VTTPTPPPARREKKLADATGAELDALLAPSDQQLADQYPGERPGRQPAGRLGQDEGVHGGLQR